MSPRPKTLERGSALLMSMMTSLVLAGMVLATTGEISAMRRTTQIEFQAEAQARSLAEAGLVDAYAWFRRQAVQPVADFQPRLALSEDPPVNETDDPQIGLVREFEISPGLWGRYVVRRGTDGELFSDEDGNGVWTPGEYFQDLNGDGRRTPGRGTRDVTAERGLPGTGAVWLVEATGTIFRRPRADLALGEGVNNRIAIARVATEVRRLTVAPPADATICAERLDQVKIGNRSRLRGENTGITGSKRTGRITLYSGGEILTPAKSAKLPAYSTTVRDVFGVDLGQLKSMADISTSSGVDGLPRQIPDFNLVVVEGDAQFSSDHPLRGTGVLVVNGDLTISDGSNSFFNGVIHVSGNLRVRAPAYIRGTIIARGGVDLAGTGGDYVEIEHDTGIISRLLTVMGQYRLSKANYTPGELTLDGRPRDALGPNADENGDVDSGIPPVTTPPPTTQEPLELLDTSISTLAAWMGELAGEPGARDAEKAIDDLEDAVRHLEKDPPEPHKADGHVAKAIDHLADGVADGDLEEGPTNELIDQLQELHGSL